MRILLALLLLLVAAVPTAAQEPTVVCTRVVVPEGSELVDSPWLRGEPPGGDCDTVVWLPLVLVDPSMLMALEPATCSTQPTLDDAGGEPIPCE